MLAGAALQNAPSRSPLANPDLLAYLIDETLGDLLASILYPPVDATSTDDVPHAELAKVTPGCGSNPYTGYFLASAAALVATTRPIEPTWRLRKMIFSATRRSCCALFAGEVSRGERLLLADVFAEEPGDAFALQHGDLLSFDVDPAGIAKFSQRARKGFAARAHLGR